ncbi:hypothetical protein ABPG72_014155 [Tetrahymena utriculariae]
MLRSISQQLLKLGFNGTKAQQFQQLTFLNRFRCSIENKKSQYYKLHEVQFIKLGDTRDECDQLVQSQYFNDCIEDRMKFMENKLGLNKCVELKYKLNYILQLRDKEMYQQKKIIELIHIAIKYMQKQKIRFESLDDKNQQQFIYFLRNLNELMVYMNIINPNIWREYFESIVVVSKNKGYNYHFVQLLNSVDVFCKKFYNESSDLFRSIIVFKEEDLVNIISPKLILQLLHNLEKCPVKDPNPKSYVLTLYHLASIIWKIQKSHQTFFSGYHRNQFFASQQQKTIEVLSNIQEIDLAMSLYFSMGITGAITDELQQSFNSFFISKKEQLQKQENVAEKIIDLWVKIGKGSQELYDVIDSFRIKKILKSKDIAQILRWLLISPCTNIQIKPQIIKEIFKHLTKESDSFNNISYFQIDILFNVLCYYYSQMPEAISKDFFNTSIFQQILDHMRAGYLIEQKQGESRESIIDLKKVIQNIKSDIKNQTGIKFNYGDEQNLELNQKHLKQEQISLNSLVYWLKQQGLEDEFVILTNQKIYLYEIDILIYSKRLDKLIGLEITGKNYQNVDGSLIGKRNLKNKIFELNGLPLAYFDVSEEEIFNNHISLSVSRKKSKIKIADELFQIIENLIGYQYPKKEIQDFKKFILKQDVQQISDQQQ